MNPVLQQWQTLPSHAAASEVLSCCGSTAWAARLAAGRPYTDEQQLFAAASAYWRALPQGDWMEAFRSHPRIGEQHAEQQTTATSTAWSRSEQSQMSEANTDILERMQQGHRAYEQRFGRIFIVCASGKQPEEMLRILDSRLANDPATELEESAGQQEQIMLLRLRKWLAAA